MALELTSIAAIQTYLNDATLTSDVLTPFANAAEDAIAQFCNRWDANGHHWLTAARVEYFRGLSSDQVVLRWSPFTAIASIGAVSGADSSGVETIQAYTLSDWSIDGLPIGAAFSTTAGLLVHRIGHPGWGWGNGGGFRYGSSFPGIGGPYCRDLKVTYTGGYTIVPPSLERAATMLAANMYRNTTVDPTVQSERLGDFSQTFKADSPNQTGSLPSSIAQLVQPYVRAMLP